MATPDTNPSLSDFEAQLRRLNSRREAELSPEEEAPAEAAEEYYTPERMAAFFSPEEADAPAEVDDNAVPEDGEGDPGEAYDAYLKAAEQGAAQEPAPEAVRPAPQRRGAANPARQAPAAKKSREKKPAPPETPEGKSAGGRLRSALRILGNTLKVILTTLLLLVVFLVAVILVVTRGPSEDARRLFVLSTNETSALKFVPSLFLPQDTVQAILHPEKTQQEAHVFRELPFESEAASAGEGETQQELVQITEENVSDELELIDIKGGTFKGKMLIIHDPTRVKISSIKDYGIDFGNYGIYLTDFIERSGAIAGTNAGGFYDPNGQGNGGTPDGVVIREGKLAFGSPYSVYTDVIGFDADHILHVGDMSGQQALDAGIVEGISFAAGPVLIQDGVKRTGLGGGVNPRTCIGQRSDGAVLLAVIEGRHPDSLGATYDDLANMMEEYGAVNAANLDGGSSSAMIYNGEQITKGSTIIGSRPMCTAILVLP